MFAVLGDTPDVPLGHVIQEIILKGLCLTWQRFTLKELCRMKQRMVA
jgi:hypothetical protein